MSQEEVLKGGNVNHIIRKENTVLRPTGYWSPSVHELLKHLEKQGFKGAPRFLGVDDSDRELRKGAAEGNLAFQKMVDEGHLAHYESEIRFVTDHFNDWV
ncbi:hypothetical protein ACFSL6_10525 [Paenibacillus thailandensis]|uniref:Uncharacterized protein n=1 Tax=Paenibacillus thailandensis TaxID=393250 RepID=A0ABW5R4U1_9BACL